MGPRPNEPAPDPANPGTVQRPAGETPHVLGPDSVFDAVGGSVHSLAGKRPNGPHAFLSPADRPGELGRLGRYRIIKLLGEGGMGLVFQAEDDGLQRAVALKVMRPEVARDPNARERFLREGRAAASIKSDHVITIYDVGEANGIVYLAMEYLVGVNLEEWLLTRERARQAPVSALMVVLLAKDILKGLMAAHAKGLIHRDIKPANLWIEKDTNRIKLLDFGLTRGGRSDQDLTQKGEILGTPTYMAPEQALGQTVDARADLFSVGVVLYRVLTGQSPFVRSHPVAAMIAAAYEPVPPVASLKTGMPRELGILIDRLLAKKPENRPANAKSALAVVTEVERQLRSPASAAVLRGPVGVTPTNRNSHPQSPETQGSKVRRIVNFEFTLNQDLTSFDENQFIQAMANLGLDVSRIRIASIRAGSVIVTIDGDPDALEHAMLSLQTSRVEFDVFVRTTHLVAALWQEADGKRHAIRLPPASPPSAHRPQRLPEVHEELAEAIEAETEPAGRRAPLSPAQWYGLVGGAIFVLIMVFLGWMAVMEDSGPSDPTSHGEMKVPGKGDGAEMSSDTRSSAAPVVTPVPVAPPPRPLIAAQPHASATSKGLPPQPTPTAPTPRAVTPKSPVPPAKAPVVPKLPEGVLEEFRYEIESAKDPKKGSRRVLRVDLGGGESMNFVWIEPGAFPMGAPADEVEALGPEKPQRRVTISRGFYMGMHEVTRDQYKAVTGAEPSRFKASGRLPVENVSWADADAFCTKLSKHASRNIDLPTEAEWEYACRAGTTTPFHFGSKLKGDRANCDGNYPYGTTGQGKLWDKTVEVGSYSPNPWGLYDMHGNVWEWCKDYYGPYDAISKVVDPFQSLKQSEDCRVLRGGSWYTEAGICRAAYRHWRSPDSRRDSCGFRACLRVD